MSGKRRLTKSIKGLDITKQDKPRQIRGILGNVIGGNQVVEVPTRPGYVWVRLRDQQSEIIQAFNDNVSPVYDLPVFVTRDSDDPTRYIVQGRDTAQYQNWGAGSAYLPRHANQHSFSDDAGAAGDVVWVFGRQFMPFLGYPSGSAGAGNIIVSPYTFYSQNGQWIYAGGTGTSSIVTYKPTGSNARVVLVYVDEYGNPQVSPGSYFAATITGTSQVINYLPSLPSGSFPISAIRLVSGTSIINWQNIYDIRPFYSESISVLGGTVGGGGGGIPERSLPIYDDHVFKTTGTIIDFTDNISVVVTGSVAFVSSVASGGGGIPERSLPIQDDSIFRVTGTAISFDKDLIVTVSGTVAHVEVPANTFASGSHTHPAGATAIQIYEDGIFQATGTLIDFQDNLDVFVTGTVAFIKTYGNVIYSISGTSNPPTEAQLISAFGLPDIFHNRKQIGHLNDNNDAINEYLVVSDGGHYWFSTLAKSILSSISVSVIATGTIATESTRWFGRSSIADFGNGSFIISYIESPAHFDNGDEVIHIKFSNDYGQSWSNEDQDLSSNPISGFPATPPGAGTGSALGPGETALITAPDNTLILMCSNVDYNVSASGTWKIESSDNGLTWGSWSKITFSGIANSNVVFAPTDWTLAGTIIYAAATQYQDAYVGAASKNILIKSIDSGDTWSYVSDITSYTEDTIETAIEYVGNNTFVTMTRNTANNKTYKRVSTDLGLTWGTLTEVQSIVGVIVKAVLKTRSHIKGYANWWEDSVLILSTSELTTPGSSTPRRNAIWISQDKGNTWSDAYYIDIEIEDGGYGDIAWDNLQNQYVAVNVYGLQAAADLRQYNLSISGI